jgi:hypothetical protein
VTWFTFPDGWGTYDLNGLAETELAVTGAHGYATEADAEAHPNASPTALQQILLQGFKAASASPAGAGASGILNTPSSSGGLPGLAENLLGGLGSRNFWLRALKVAAGLALIIIGVAHLDRAQTITTAAAAVRGAAAA